MSASHYVCPKCGSDRSESSLRRVWDYLFALPKVISGLNCRECLTCWTRYWVAPVRLEQPDVQFRQDGIYLVWRERIAGPFESIDKADDYLDGIDQTGI